MKVLGLLILAALALFQLPCGSRTGLTTPTPTPIQPCCGRNENGARITFGTFLADNTSEVPVELLGCGVNSDQITGIQMSGQMAGCASMDRAEVVFTPLVVKFTTAACIGNAPPLAERAVALRDVQYTANLRLDLSPPCVQSSSVQFPPPEGSDPAFTTLFRTRGSDTLLPILDRFVLAWASSNPRVTCPFGLTFTGVRGITSRCAN
jgi:hypothetical protein